ncbi:MAG: FAD:protein FMN transferase, partial [Victivallaceae bacterium]
MPKWLSAALIIAAAVLLTAGVIFYAVGRHHFGRDVMVADIEVMSTVAEITLPAGKNTGEDILAAAEALASVQSYCNIFDEESELAELNRTAHEQPFVCSEELYAVLSEARRAYSVSEGRFDISCLPLMRIWGFHAGDDDEELTRPDSEELLSALAMTGLDKVVFDDAARS